jgi:hypothetical protein
MQANQIELKLSRTHGLLFYADDANLMGKNINTTKKNTKAPLVTNKVVGLEIYCIFSTEYRTNSQNKDI